MVADAARGRTTLVLAAGAGAPRTAHHSPFLSRPAELADLVGEISKALTALPA